MRETERDRNKEPNGLVQDVKASLAIGLTSDIEQGLVTITCVSNVFGDTAIHSTVCMTHPGDLENAIGQESVSAETETENYIIPQPVFMYRN